MPFQITRFAVLAVVFGGLAPVSAAAAPDCTCRYAGKTYQNGEYACIKLGGGYRLAQCSLSENVSSWRFLQEGCLGVSGLDRQPAGLSVTGAAVTVAAVGTTARRPTAE